MWSIKCRDGLGLFYCMKEERASEGNKSSGTGPVTRVREREKGDLDLYANELGNK